MSALIEAAITAGVFTGLFIVPTAIFVITERKNRKLQNELAPPQPYRTWCDDCEIRSNKAHGWAEDEEDE